MGEREEIRERLAIYRFGQRRAINAVAKRFAGAMPEAVGGCIWRRRGWLAVATGDGLELVRRPWVFGRPLDRHYPWAELTAYETGSSGMSLRLTFGEREVRLNGIGPPKEYTRFVDAVRRRLGGGAVETSAEDIRASAHRALGGRRTLELDAAIVALPDLLDPGETVEQVAAATLGAEGLLVITDRRVLLTTRAIGVDSRDWSVHRSWIRTVDVLEDGLRLDLGIETVVLDRVRPAEQRHELADRLRPVERAREDPGPGDPDDPALPEPPWRLTAAEAYLLRYVEDGAALEHPVFRLALLELVARGALGVEPVWVRRRWLPGWRFSRLLVRGPRFRSIEAPALAPVLAAFERTPVVRGREYHNRGGVVEGVRVNDLDPGAELVAACVESLYEHGLARKPLSRTAAGEAADDALGEWLRLARGAFPERAGDHDLSWVRAFLTGAGAAVLLADSAIEALAGLARRLPDEPWLDVRVGAVGELHTDAAAIDAAFRVIIVDH